MVRGYRGAWEIAWTPSITRKKWKKEKPLMELGKSGTNRAHDSLVTVRRYIERSPLRVGLVEHAEHRRLSSMYHWRGNGLLDRIPGPVTAAARIRT
jgi:hypothetical protein